MSTRPRNYVVTWADITFSVVYYCSFILQLYLLYKWTNVSQGIEPTFSERAVIIGIGSMVALATLYLGLAKRRLLGVVFSPTTVNPLFFGRGAMAISIILAFLAVVPSVLLLSSLT